MKTTDKKKRAAAFERLLNSSTFKFAPPGQQLDLMLGHKPFEDLLKDGHVLGIEAARLQLGYSAWGLRRVCRAGKVGHVKRGREYFFLPAQVAAAFEVVPTNTSAAKS